jgi:hypothetical protein
LEKICILWLILNYHVSLFASPSLVNLFITPQENICYVSEHYYKFLKSANQTYENPFLQRVYVIEDPEEQQEEYQKHNSIGNPLLFMIYHPPQSGLRQQC